MNQPDLLTKYLHLQQWPDILSPSFISAYFIVFVFILSFIYYLMPKKARWTVLLFGSVLFYSLAGVSALLTILLTAFLVYTSGHLIANTNKREKKRILYFGSTVLVLLGVLFYGKMYALFRPPFYYLIPLGISYYTFSSIGYLADIYWGKAKPERNFFHITLFLLFFPKILQGPISSHTKLLPQLKEGHSFDYTKYCYGMQLAVWGYFKKLVVADRIAIFTSAVFNHYQDYGGAVLFLSMLLAAMQLYCDFSGCMDIAGGVSQMFGIELEQNFNHPFFARSGAEFWQRWHMTLSGWFRDYLFLPISRSARVKKIGKYFGNKWGAAARKSSTILIASFFVWMATGIWHGSGLPYLAWGFYWYLVIGSSTLLGGKYQQLRNKLGINEDAAEWKLFQMIRTYLIFSFGRLLTIPNDLRVSWLIFLRFFTKLSLWELFDGTLLEIYNKAPWTEYLILTAGILTVWLVDLIQTRCFIREKIAGWNIIVRCAFYSLAVLAVLILGKYGAGYGNTTFIYMNF